ncbi:DUF2325 domain-containing protein [Staphylococcus americanisciuri]|uniref:DUF2325 domain-containing protein n=1 Tax=Staphylococcus americanisciuri TaxID=2973940 RepID=A0ABT2F294_9STAP|nr:DUF2325 domain-containing protein [Staphylococcus americanisciuri]MCS4486580.1 DUF2325 domain-containing protein [Staphylococcus americanisciuri]
MKKEMKAQIVQLIKDAWIDDILNTQDIEVLEKRNKHYLKALRQIELLQPEDKEAIADNISEQLPTHQHKKENSDTYTFVRHLLGGEGVNPETGKTVFVPESVVRNEALEHGDKLIFEENGNGYNRHAYHKLNAEKDHSVAAIDIECYDYAIVDYDDSIHRYICKKHFDHGELKSIPMCLLNEKDVIKFNINKEDIVSIAHTPNHTTSRIRWKYDADEIMPTPVKKKASYYKEDHESQELDEAEKEVFKDIEVGIIGASQFINNYIEEVEQRGGKVHHTESDTQLQVETLVSKSDIVVIPILTVSHAKAEQAKAKAKKEEKPFIILKNSGRSSFVNELKEHLHLIKREEEAE